MIHKSISGKEAGAKQLKVSKWFLIPLHLLETGLSGLFAYSLGAWGRYFATQATYSHRR